MTEDKTFDLFENSTVSDTLPLPTKDDFRSFPLSFDSNLYKGFGKFVSSTFGRDKWKSIDHLLSSEQISTAAKKYVEGKLRAFRSNLTPLSKDSISSMRVEELYVQNASRFSYTTERPIITNNTSLISSLVVFGVNLNVNGSLTYLSPRPYSIGNTVISVNYDKDAYNKFLMETVNKSYNVSAYFNDLDITGVAKDFFRANIDAEINQLKNINPQLRDFLAMPESITSILHLNQEQFLLKLGDEHINLDGSSDSLLTRLFTLKSVLNKKGFDINRVIGDHKKLETNISTAMNSSSILSRVSNDVLPLTVIQKLFLKLKSFRAGNFGMDRSSPFTEPSFLSGIHLSFEKTIRGLNLDIGKTNNFHYLQNISLNKSLLPADRNIVVASIKTFRSGSVSLSQSKNAFRPASPFNSYSSLSKSVAQFSLKQSFDLGLYGKLVADISKSAGQYERTQSSIDDQLLQQKNAIGNILNEFWQTVAIGLRHDVNLTQLKLSGNVYFKYSGGGFQGASSSSIVNGRRQFGGNFKKAFLRNRLLVQGFGDYRIVPYLNDLSNSLRNKNFTFKTKYKIKKSFSTGLQFGSTVMSQLNGINKEKNYSITRIACETNLNYTVVSHPATLYVSFGGQLINNPQINNFSGKSFVASLNHSLVINQSSINANVFLSKEISGGSLLGNTISAEASFQRPLSRLIQVNSSALLFQNGDKVKQIGVRQGLQAQFKKGFALSGFFDFRHNMIANQLQYLYSTTRGEISINYSFLN